MKESSPFLDEEWSCFSMKSSVECMPMINADIGDPCIVSSVIYNNNRNVDISLNVK
jgi:hypothetical protein